MCSNGQIMLKTTLDHLLKKVAVLAIYLILFVILEQQKIYNLFSHNISYLYDHLYSIFYY